MVVMSCAAKTAWAAFHCATWRMETMRPASSTLATGGSGARPYRWQVIVIVF